MPRVRYARGALADLRRVREFLRPQSPAAAVRAGETILKALRVLGQQPQLGRPIDGLPLDFREWVIDFGDSGYVARYRIDAEAVTVLAIRHQKEAGY